MKKIILFIMTFIFMMNVNAQYKEPNFNPPVQLNSKYVYVYNIQEDRVMYEFDSNKQIPVASLTKIMTAIIAIENINLDTEVIMIREDFRDMYEYAIAGFDVGDKVTVKDLVYAVLLPSGSDAVNALVRTVSSSEEEFIKLMNNKVKELGLNNTHFSNAIGKDEDNYSSMYDVFKILEYALDNPIFKEIFTVKEYNVNNLLLKGPLYRIDSNLITGAKTGFTYDAMYCLASFSEVENLKYIVVTAYANSYKEVIEDHINIYNYYYNNYGYNNYNINFDIEIENGKEQYYNVNINKKLYLENTYKEKFLTTKYNGIEPITKKLKKGDKLGEVDIYYYNNIISKVDVYLEDVIEYKNYTWIFIPITLIVILLIIFMRKRKKR